MTVITGSTCAIGLSIARHLAGQGSHTVINGVTKTVAHNAAEYGVTVNAVWLGYMLTLLFEKQVPEQAKARGISEDAVIRDVLLATQPTKKFVPLEEVSALVGFLCSPEASSINGAIIPINGGWTAH